MKIPSILSGSTMNGTNVQNAAGESIGDVKDVMIDVTTGQVAYVVLSFGGFLGMGDKLFAVPFDALDLDSYADSGKYTLDVDKDFLEDAPGFDKDNWPHNPDREFLSAVYTHYGVSPYWEKYQSIG